VGRTFPVSDRHAIDRQCGSGLHQDRLTLVIGIDGGGRRGGAVDLYGACHHEAVLVVITGTDVDDLLAGVTGARRARSSHTDVLAVRICYRYPDPVAETKSTWVPDTAATADCVTPGTNVTIAANIQPVTAHTVARRRTVADPSRFVLLLTRRTLLASSETRGRAAIRSGWPAR